MITFKQLQMLAEDWSRHHLSRDESERLHGPEMRGLEYFALDLLNTEPVTGSWLEQQHDGKLVATAGVTTRYVVGHISVWFLCGVLNRISIQTLDFPLMDRGHFNAFLFSMGQYPR